MKIELNIESAKAAIIEAIKTSDNPAVYVDCNGNCYTEEARPEESEILTAEVWSFKTCMKPSYMGGWELNDFRGFTDSDFEEVAHEEATYVKHHKLESALDAILEREDEMYNNVLWEHDYLPEELLHKIKKEFDFLRDISGDWNTCRAQEETFPIFFNCDEVEVLMQNATHEEYTRETITGIFDDADKVIFEAAKAHSPEMCSAVLTQLLNKWENTEIDDTMMHFYGIENGIIHLFIINY